MAYLEINISSPVPVYRQIMDQMRRLVGDGEIAAGNPLPSVRQLAAELAVNPNTVAKAYQLLELEGTIVTRKRRGAFVGQGSTAQAALAGKRRLGEVVDRFIEEAMGLGASAEDIVSAVADRARPDKQSARGQEGDGPPDGAGASGGERIETPSEPGQEVDG